MVIIIIKFSTYLFVRSYNQYKKLFFSCKNIVKINYYVYYIYVYVRVGSICVSMHPCGMAVHGSNVHDGVTFVKTFFHGVLVVAGRTKTRMSTVEIRREMHCC